MCGLVMLARHERSAVHPSAVMMLSHAHKLKAQAPPLAPGLTLLAQGCTAEAPGGTQ